MYSLNDSSLNEKDELEVGILSTPYFKVFIIFLFIGYNNSISSIPLAFNLALLQPIFYITKWIILLRLVFLTSFPCLNIFNGFQEKTDSLVWHESFFCTNVCSLLSFHHWLMFLPQIPKHLQFTCLPTSSISWYFCKVYRPCLMYCCILFSLTPSSPLRSQYHFPGQDKSYLKHSVTMLLLP